MQINIHSDNSVEKSEALNRHVQSVVEATLKHFAGQVTRVEVHLSDSNAQKSGDGDSRCMMEARLAGLEPIAVAEHDATLHQAINGAATKLHRAIENDLGRLHSHVRAKKPSTQLESDEPSDDA
jgi:ribosomal subunit interface protein